jgi:hypothetical protein
MGKYSNFCSPFVQKAKAALLAEWLLVNYPGFEVGQILFGLWSVTRRFGYLFGTRSSADFG